MLVGLVLGLAIYNAVLLDFPLPLALYRKLLGQPAGLRDLADMDPTLGKSLRQLLDFEGAPAHPQAHGCDWPARSGRRGALQGPAPAARLRRCACRPCMMACESFWPYTALMQP